MVVTYSHISCTRLFFILWYVMVYLSSWEIIATYFQTFQKLKGWLFLGDYSRQILFKLCIILILIVTSIELDTPFAVLVTMITLKSRGNIEKVKLKVVFFWTSSCAVFVLLLHISMHMLMSLSFKEDLPFLRCCLSRIFKVQCYVS